MRVRGDKWRGGEAERTARVVTRLVSQPLISLLKLVQPEEKSQVKSVTCEIFHKFIGPYVAFAAVGLAHQAHTAVCRAALLAKTLFWPAAGETPPRSSTARSGVKQLREVDSIDTMCVSVLAREGYKKACGRGATHTARSRELER